MTTNTATTDRLVLRRYADMKKAAVAYAITRINDFTDGGLELTPHEREALLRLAENRGQSDE